MTVDKELVSVFRQVMHLTFCGKLNESSKCPNACPARRANLDLYNWDKVRIKDILEFKKD